MTISTFHLDTLNNPNYCALDEGAAGDSRECLLTFKCDTLIDSLHGLGG